MSVETELQVADLSGRQPKRYEDIKALAKATGRRIPDLLALAPVNDPFYIMPAQAEQGRWFASLWERFGFVHGVHLRRIHYKLVSQPEPVLLLDGKPYENTDHCWQCLCSSSKAARALELIDPTALEDKRNPQPWLFREYQDAPPNPSACLGEFDDWWIPRISTNLTAVCDWRIPDIEISGYEYRDNDQPFHLELLSEKSTMDDILIPACRLLGIVYAPFIGFASNIGTINMLRRIARSGRPGVVFYISDFDPAGALMPCSVARQLEYWREHYAPRSEILLNPVVLTPEQVNCYQLPPIPIKESDRRQGNFLARYGVKGATELDALEALHPGELRNIITKAAAPYRDTAIAAQLADAKEAAQDTVTSQWRQQTKPHAERLAALKREADAIASRYRAQLEVLSLAINADLAPVIEELGDLRQAISETAAGFRPTLPPRPESLLALPAHFAGLFDSRRDYLEQLAYYKATELEAAP